MYTNDVAKVGTYLINIIATTQYFTTTFTSPFTVVVANDCSTATISVIATIADSYYFVGSSSFFTGITAFSTSNSKCSITHKL